MHITNNNKNAHWFFKVSKFCYFIVLLLIVIIISKSDHLLYRLMTANQQNNILKVS